MKFTELMPETEDGPILIEPEVFEDDRGYFEVGFDRDAYLKLGGLLFNPVYESISRSRRGVVRGLHTQVGMEQSKLVRCAWGSVYDVAVDARPNSKTFGKHVGVVIDEASKKQLYVPKGFLHGFQALEASVLVYLQDVGFHPEVEQGIIYSDARIDIRWPLSHEIITSKKDAEWPTLAEAVKRNLL